MTIRSSGDGRWTIECIEPDEKCVEDRKIFECLVQDFGWKKMVDEHNKAVVLPPK
jgi:hypothetical protein